ncbi:hypothetical protein DFH09DRAFT_1357542 [Mycena vulgaris]|nr:hypothetical protein DFH09DRAFT_1357542 [Mycena vulgaris]
MSVRIIQWLLSILQKLHLFRRLSTRWFFLLFSAVLRAGASATNTHLPPGPQKTPRVSDDSNSSGNGTYVHRGTPFTPGDHDLLASLIPASLSRSSLDITGVSVQNLPATLPTQHPHTTDPNQPLPALPPSSSPGLGENLSSPNGTLMNLPGPVTRGFGDVALASVPLLSEADPRIFPGTPESVGRYDHKIIISNEPTQFTILPRTFSLRPIEPPTGWDACLHPNGVRYFFHEEKRVFTEANIFDGASFDLITKTLRTIHEFILAHRIDLPADADLVLDEYTYSDQSKGFQYYFVHHKDRCVFWLDRVESDMFPVATQVNGMTTASQIRNELEAQYWYHCELFPRSLQVTHEIIDELRDLVLHALGDVITFIGTTVSWKVDELNHMVKLIDGFGKNVGKNVDSKLSGSSCIVGRLMWLFVRARVYNFHGEPGARLHADESVYGTVRKRTLLITLLNPLLFYAPDFHLVGLHTIYTDGLSTVVLNANVAFLSIQSVDQNGVASLERTPAQISSYLSMLTSIGAIIIGLLLVKQNRDRDRLTASDAAEFIFNRTHPTLGLETLAVLYSLPYAMLIWSMISFLAAFSFMCFERSSVVTRTLIAVLWTAVAALILWCIFTAWESGDWDWLQGCPCMGTATEDVLGEPTASKSKQQKWRWAWPSITLCKGSYGSQPAV